MTAAACVLLMLPRRRRGHAPAYGTDEAQEGRDAFLEKRDQDFSDVLWHY